MAMEQEIGREFLKEGVVKFRPSTKRVEGRLKFPSQGSEDPWPDSVNSVEWADLNENESD